MVCLIHVGLRRVLRIGMLGALLAGWGWCSAAWAQAVDSRAAEYQIKAAFLCKFGNYVEWPLQTFARLRSPFTIGVVAADDVVEELTRAAASISVEGRPIVLRKLRRGDSLDGVQILFVAGASESQLAEWLGAAKGQPILTVTESPQGLPPGSSINFVVVEDKVRFDVAAPSSEQSGIKISSRLLGVARKVVARSS